MKRCFFVFLSLLATSLNGENLNEGFSDEKLAVTENNVFIVSSFNEADYFTVYSHTGELVWEVPFTSKIETWKKLDDQSVLIFSKTRNGMIFFLTCVNQEDGKVIWEKRIFSPAFNTPSEPPAES